MTGLAQPAVSFGLVIFLWVLNSGAWADVGTPGSLTCGGALKQGGIVVCRAEAGSSVDFGEMMVDVPDTGLATFGLRRDAPPELEIKEVGGSGASLVFSIAPRKDPVRRIEGMDCDKVDARSDAQKAHASRSWVKKTEAFQRFDGSARLLAGFNWPTEGRPTSPFGPVRTYEGISAVTGEPCEKTSVHRGYDIAAPIGTPIIAPAAGTVILAEDDLYYEGGTIFLDHGAGLVSVFMHMSDVDVAVGETVVLGQKLGAVGNTGRTTGPHLHWAVKWRDMGSDDRSRDRYIDPELLVELGAEIWVGPGDQADGLP